MIQPLDLEALVLTKGSDNHYLAQTFRVAMGAPRVWGLRVIESVATEEYRSANTTDQRVALVLDSRRAATIYTRQQATIEVGYNSDDFTENRRTIRAEERVAFGVQQPYLIKYVETVAEVA
jgi:HK97 family phage major capsid protein